MSDVFPTAPPPTVTRLDADEVPAEVVDQLRAGAVIAPADVGVIDLTGPGDGAVTCFQGLLTSDLEKPGDGAFVYGALLTPKGMIVVDGWAARLGTRVRFTVPGEGRERALAILQRSVPPRLARVVDRSADMSVLRVVGAHAVAVLGAAGLPVPEGPNRVLDTTVGDMPLEIARAGDQAPFVFQITSGGEHRDAVQSRLVKSGAHAATGAALELARILAGWPRLASEVDEKTIPQEVRYDEIGGVSYTKGCYTGQETVSRLHFRGHANRQLRGLLFETDPPAAPAEGWSAVSHDERDVGRVTSIAWLPDGGGSVLGRWIGLAMVRREVPLGAVVRAAGREARAVALPFDVPSIGPA
ncbi:MAG TPA: glycine cleavage T C-terminal barrel domain-containing protein [Gemmatimonadales bacterium]|nr:glycine cleavage T C-terminal barrel domain-containing protein [Gemmatimonadales bacterium]